MMHGSMLEGEELRIFEELLHAWFAHLGKAS